LFRQILGTQYNYKKTVDGFYNDYNPEFIYDCLLGASEASAPFKEHNRVPNIFASGREDNQDSYKILYRKSLGSFIIGLIL
jgi:hypothetical protein